MALAVFIRELDHYGNTLSPTVACSFPVAAVDTDRIPTYDAYTIVFLHCIVSVAVRVVIVALTTERLILDRLPSPARIHITLPLVIVPEYKCESNIVSCIWTRRLGIKAERDSYCML